MEMMTNKIRYFLLILMLALVAQNSSSQVDLHRKISINVQNLFVPQTLHVIEQGYDFFFAYNPRQIPAYDRVTMNERNIALKKALDRILSNRFAYTTIGNHVILRLKGINTESEDFIILGVVRNSDGLPLDSAVVYAVKENKAAITNNDGAFHLRLKEPTQYIHISCPDYIDTLLVAETLNTEKIINLNRKVPSTTLSPSEIKELKVSSSQKQFEKLSLVRNLVPQSALYLNRLVNTIRSIPVQVSFLPGMGSQQLTKGLNVNHFSLNILAGYSKGLSGFEIGGLANITESNVKGGQVAGLVNVVNGQINGLQLAGIFNYTFSKITGAQISGIGNISNHDVEGLQLAGIFNNNKGTIDGVQLGGVLNTNLSKITGLQLAGIANIQVNQITGCQISGIYGLASDVNGVQLSGIMSHTTHDVSGVQVSSILNRARKLNGLQFGLVNIADTIESGVQVGLFNFVKNGYRALEFTKDETYYCNFMYKTGGKKLYSILDAGIGKDKVGVGYGVGFIQPIYKRLSVNIDAIYSSLLATNSSDTYQGSMVNVRLGLNYRLEKHLTLVGGLSFNYYDPDKENEKSGSAGKISFTGNSSSMISQAFQNNNKAMWFGWFFGVKF